MAQPLEPGPGQHDGVELALGQLAQSGVDVAADGNHLYVLTGGPDLGRAAQTAGAHPRSRGQLLERDRATDHVAGIGALRDGHQLQARGQLGRHVLGRVHRDLDLLGEQGPLQLRDPARLVLLRRPPVAGSGDRHQLGLALDSLGDPARLGQGQRACARPDADQRRPTAAPLVRLMGRVDHLAAFLWLTFSSSP